MGRRAFGSRGTAIGLHSNRAFEANSTPPGVHRLLAKLLVAGYTIPSFSALGPVRVTRADLGRFHGGLLASSQSLTGHDKPARQIVPLRPPNRGITSCIAMRVTSAGEQAS